MPFKITVKHDFDRFERALTDLKVKHLPFATAQALNDVAEEARSRVVASMPVVFDRPVDFTLNSIGIKRASKQSLQAEIFVKDIQAKYLRLEETGGQRTPADNVRNPNARALVAPGKIKLDSHGNMPLGATNALRAAAKDGTEGRAKRQKAAFLSKFGIVYFKGAGPHGRGPGGFFQRLGGGHIERLTSFEPHETYKPRLQFQYHIRQAFAQTFRVAMVGRLREAIANPRK